MSRQLRHSLLKIADSGKIFQVVDKYLRHCRGILQKDQQGGGCKLSKDLFPNLSGFCRFLGVGLSEIERLRAVHPEDADYILAVMEDEALNADNPSATLIGTYLKCRMEYAKREKNESSSAECGEVKVIFEHDISEDGA